MSHHVLKIPRITNFEANDMNTNVTYVRRMLFKMAKERCFYDTHKDVNKN